MNPFDHLLALAFGVVIPLVGVMQGRKERRRLGAKQESEASVQTLYANAAFLWVCAGIVVAAWWLSDRGAATLGFAFVPPDPVVALSLAILAALWIGSALWQFRSTQALRRARARFRNYPIFMPRRLGHMGPIVFLAITAGITEEIVFRGHLVSYAAYYLGDAPWAVVAAVVLPAVPFGITHLYQGWSAGLSLFALAGLFGGIYMYTGSLVVPMVAHVLFDLAGFLHVILVERVAARSDQQTAQASKSGPSRQPARRGARTPL